MTIQVNIAEAKAKLSELVARAERGEEVVIARHGKPIVTLAVKPPSEPAPRGPRKLGIWEHLNLNIPMSVFEPDPETLDWMDKSVFPDK